LQVRDLTAKNLELQAAVKARDAELRDLKELAEAYSTMQSQDVQTMKIIDLAKKVRQWLSKRAVVQGCCTLTMLACTTFINRTAC
jgi:hypothetical protein